MVDDKTTHPDRAPVRILLTDANILINFLHLGQIDLLACLPGLRCVVPDHVVNEVRDPGQAETLRGALARGILDSVVIDDPAAIELYADLHRIMGEGEAACLALASSRGWWIASDERRRFRREVEARIGLKRLVTTPGLIVYAIRAGLVTVDVADEWKSLLESKRFKMAFQSFKDECGPDPGNKNQSPGA